VVAAAGVDALLERWKRGGVLDPRGAGARRRQAFTEEYAAVLGDDEVEIREVVA
jgi:hypothetical protein